MANARSNAGRSKMQTLVAGARRQKAIIEYRDISGPEWWVMHDDGQIEMWDTASHALRSVQKAASRRNKTITITTIEWRNTPEGFVPPKGDQS